MSRLLVRAVLAKDLRRVLARLAAGDDPRYSNNQAIATAAMMPGDRVDVVEALHRAGSRADNAIGWAAYHAAKNDNRKVMRFLIAHGLDLEKWGGRSIAVANAQGHPEIAEIIRSAMGGEP